MRRYLIIYNWKIFDDKKSLFICVKDGDSWIVQEDITPNGENFYFQNDRKNYFIGIRLHKKSLAIIDISIYDKIEKDDIDDYLKRIGVK